MAALKAIQKKNRRPVVYRAIAEQLRRKLINFSGGTGAFLPSEAELSRQFGVSRMTLRAALKVLQHERLIRPKRPLGWEIIPGGGVPAIERLVCVIHGATPSSDFPMMRAAGLLCQEKGIAFKPLFAERWPDLLTDLFTARETDGLLFLSGPAAPDALLKEAVWLHLPVSAVGFRTDRIDSIHPDWDEAAALLVNHLADTGHRNLLYAGWSDGEEESFIRLHEGTRRSAAARGIPMQSLLTQLNWMSADEEAALEGLLSSATGRPDALVIGSQAIYGQILNVIARLRLRIPEDVSVTLLGEDPHPAILHSISGVSVTHVKFDWSAAIQWAVERVCRRMQDPLMPVGQGPFPLRLVTGESSGAR